MYIMQNIIEKTPERRETLTGLKRIGKKKHYKKAAPDLPHCLNLYFIFLFSFFCAFERQQREGKGNFFTTNEQRKIHKGGKTKDWAGKRCKNKVFVLFLYAKLCLNFLLHLLYSLILQHIFSEFSVSKRWSDVEQEKKMIHRIQVLFFQKMVNLITYKSGYRL
uniref:Uncharacterized protein n=1 Tax=Cacopsylla melanoneura TaxID=428564 RepID=A0A8D8RD89_9HEMI